MGTFLPILDFTLNAFNMINLFILLDLFDLHSRNLFPEAKPIFWLLLRFKILKPKKQDYVTSFK